jgi:hypothetical protein
MVEYVEELRPELEREALSQLECFEYGEIERLERRPVGRRWIAPQYAGTVQRNAPRRGVRNWTGGSQQTGLLECLWVPKPTYFFVRVDVQSQLLALPGNIDIVAVCTGSGCRGATQSNRLTTLKSYDPIATPTPDDCVGEPSRVTKELLVFTEWKLIAATEMKYISDIERG